MEEHGGNGEDGGLDGALRDSSKAEMRRRWVAQMIF